jgi:hypothetical protein
MKWHYVPHPSYFRIVVFAAWRVRHRLVGRNLIVADEAGSGVKSKME